MTWITASEFLSLTCRCKEEGKTHIEHSNDTMKDERGKFFLFCGRTKCGPKRNEYASSVHVLNCRDMNKECISCLSDSTLLCVCVRMCPVVCVENMVCFESANQSEWDKVLNDADRNRRTTVNSKEQSKCVIDSCNLRRPLI